MAKKDNTHPVLQMIKSEAKELQASAKAEGNTLVYGHALDQASRKHGYKDWNSACGLTGDNQDRMSYVLGEEGSIPLTDREVEVYEMSGALSKAISDTRKGGGLIVGTQTVEDFTHSKHKTYYSPFNQFMHEYPNIQSDPNYEAIPAERCESFEDMCSFVREKNGSLFYPSNSAADLQGLSEDQKDAIESNIGAQILLGRNGQIVPFDFSTNHNDSSIIAVPGAGMSYYIESLSLEAQKENPSLSIKEATELVYRKYRIQNVLDAGESFKDIIDAAGDDDDAKFIRAFFDDKSSIEAKIYGAPMAIMETLLKSFSDDEITRLVNIPIPIHSAISRGHRAYQNEMIEKIRMIRDEADKRGLNYEVAYRDDTGFREVLLHNIATKLRKYGGKFDGKSTRAFVGEINSKHTKRNFKR